MEIIIQADKAAASKVAANHIAKLIKDKPDAVLGLATGSTPLEMYQCLIAMNLDWSQVTTFNLDEYIGLPRDHSQTYYTFMWENLFQHVNIKKENVHIPDGNAQDIPGHCADYEEKIATTGGIDIQVLGIGTDGHIGFNEQGSSFASRTRIKTLTQQTRADNARFFEDDLESVPKHCITMGIGTILDARQNILLAFGEGKSAAIEGAVEGAITASNPASALQLHETTTVCIDESAAAKLARVDYYKYVYANKPAWQQI